VTLIRVSPDVAKLVQQCMNEKADLLGPAAVRALNPNAAAQQNTATKEQYLRFPHMMKEWTKKTLPSVRPFVTRGSLCSLFSFRHMWAYAVHCCCSQTRNQSIQKGRQESRQEDIEAGTCNSELAIQFSFVMLAPTTAGGAERYPTGVLQRSSSEHVPSPIEGQVCAVARYLAKLFILMFFTTS